MLAVDGGNSKTDLALVRDDGAVLALVRGGMSSPHHIGLDGTVELLQGLFDDAVAQAGLGGGDGPVADVGQVLLAGLDFPTEEQALHEALAARGLARSLTVGNDTFAVLRAGTERGWGVAVVCGAGINCVGVGPDGRHARFPALGAISGDWGGGYDVGLAALAAAVRSEDGRGPRTRLEQAVPAYFGKTHAARAERGDPPRRDPAAAGRRAPAASCSTRPAATRWRPSSCSASRTRSSRWPRSRCDGWTWRTVRSRCCSAAACSSTPKLS